MTRLRTDVAHARSTGAEATQEAIIAALARAAADPEAEVRRAAANALRNIGGAAAEAVLRGLLNDTDENVRHAARSALGLEAPRPNLSFPTTGAPTVAQHELHELTMALSSGDARARLAAARRLGNLRDRRGVAALIGALRDGEFRVRQAAADALGNIGDAAAASALADRTADPHPRVRQSAVSALGATGGPPHVTPLVRALDDADVHVRQNAAAALGRIGTR